MSASPRVMLAAVALALAACTHDPNLGDPNTRPDYIKGEILSATYDGNGNDLLTAS